MRPSPYISHIGKVDAVIRTGRIPRARDLLPVGRIDRGKISVALGAAMHFGYFEAIGIIDPLHINFSAADDRDLSGETPQRIAGRDRAGIRK